MIVLPAYQQQNYSMKPFFFFSHLSPNGVVERIFHVPEQLLEGSEEVCLQKRNRGQKLVHRAEEVKDQLEFHMQCLFFFFLHLIILSEIRLQFVCDDICSDTYTHINLKHIRIEAI